MDIPAINNYVLSNFAGFAERGIFHLTNTITFLDFSDRKENHRLIRPHID